MTWSPNPRDVTVVGPSFRRSGPRMVRTCCGREYYPCGDGLVLGILREKVLEAGGFVRDPGLQEGLERLQRVDADAFGLEGLEFQEEDGCDSQDHEAEYRGVDYRGIKMNYKGRRQEQCYCRLYCRYAQTFDCARQE